MSIPNWPPMCSACCAAAVGIPIRSKISYTGSRNAVPPTYQDAIYGFRVVLAKVPPKAD